ncbi:hypothetical protein QE152_g19021 [Popillia japonica]|uniref:Macro domain-containing protein n=1 Tax=Popillia japonica TaxID=7064 RepID=A0AAW1KYM5_POPJA
MSTEDKVFIFTHDKYGFETTITIPFEGSIQEYVYILITHHDLPIYIADKIFSQLSKFISESSTEFYDNVTTSLIQKSKGNLIDIDEITKEWEKIFREEMTEYGERRCASDEELFATAYHKLVHSPALETMLQLEHTYALTVKEKCDEKDRQICDLSNRQTDEMSTAVDQLEKGVTESDINELATKHFEDQTLMQVQLQSEIDTIKEAQKREYREWLMQMLEQSQANNSLPTPKHSPVAPIPPMIPTKSYRNSKENKVSHPILEESFTVHLGSQLKQMHNIRILRANVMNLCSITDNSLEPTPQSLQTALGLYSNELSGLVLIHDEIGGSKLTQDFRKICQSSTEFHFPHVDDQLERISHLQQQLRKDSDLKSRQNTKHLQPGDFYITRHSNLSQVHVIFHIVSDDTLKGGDINSRHPVVLGLRNIVKTACSNDITSLTIPLLLNYEMSEDMTISWCEKRAELVFKCVKGFMIEMASWGGSDLKNLQFMLPEGISSEVFQSLTEMLPRIFKVSNPLILKSSK